MFNELYCSLSRRRFLLIIYLLKKKNEYLNINHRLCFHFTATFWFWLLITFPNSTTIVQDKLWWGGKEVKLTNSSFGQKVSPIQMIDPSNLCSCSMAMESHSTISCTITCKWESYALPSCTNSASISCHTWINATHGCAWYHWPKNQREKFGSIRLLAVAILCWFVTWYDMWLSEIYPWLNKQPEILGAKQICALPITGKDHSCVFSCH